MLTAASADLLHKLLVASRPQLVAELATPGNDPATRALLIQLRSLGHVEEHHGAWRVDDARQHHALTRALRKAA